MGVPVVGVPAAFGLRNDLAGKLFHRQRAKILLDRIVGLLGAAVPVYRVRVRGAFGRIDLGGRASGGESGGLVVHQTSHLTGGRERGTVVGLGGSGRLHVQLGRLDDNRALLLLDDVKLVRHIDAGLVDDAQRVDLRHHGLFGHIGRAGVRGSCYQRIAFRQTANVHRRSMGIPVVGILAAFGSRNDLALELFHGQRARLVSDVVIARHVLRPARNDRLENGRFHRTGIGDGAEQVDADQLLAIDQTFDQALACDNVVQVERQRGAVVHLLFRGGRNGERGLLDRQLVLVARDEEPTGNILVFFVQNDRGAVDGDIVLARLGATAGCAQVVDLVARRQAFVNEVLGNNVDHMFGTVVHHFLILAFDQDVDNRHLRPLGHVLGRFSLHRFGHARRPPGEVVALLAQRLAVLVLLTLELRRCGAELGLVRNSIKRSVIARKIRDLAGVDSIVPLQHERAVPRHLAGQHVLVVTGIKNVAGVRFRRIGVHRSARFPTGRCGMRWLVGPRSVGVLQIVLDTVVRTVLRRPNGIERLRFVQGDGVTTLVGGTGSIGFCIPLLERVAGAPVGFSAFNLYRSACGIGLCIGEGAAQSLSSRNIGTVGQHYRRFVADSTVDMPRPLVFDNIPDDGLRLRIEAQFRIARTRLLNHRVIRRCSKVGAHHRASGVGDELADLDSIFNPANLDVPRIAVSLRLCRELSVDTQVKIRTDILRRVDRVKFDIAFSGGHDIGRSGSEDRISVVVLAARGNRTLINAPSHENPVRRPIINSPIGELGHDYG